MDDSPTARALRTLDLIHQRPGVTAAELAGRLGVTERAVRRYVQTLRDADVPVHSTPGRYGGYQIGRGVRLPPVAFTGAEALALVMAVVDSHDGAPVGSATGDGVSKVLRALPESIAEPARRLWQHTAAAPSELPRPDGSITRGLVEAVAAGRRVRLEYRSAAGNEWTRDVDAWAVVVRHGLWYLLCAVESGEVRTFRVDRVTSLQVLATPSQVPADLDAVAVLESNLGLGWPYSTRVRFRAPIERVRPWVRPTMGQLTDDGDECVLTGSTSNPQMYVSEWLAEIPLPFVIEGGPELRQAMKDLVERLSAAVAPEP